MARPTRMRLPVTVLSLLFSLLLLPCVRVGDAWERVEMHGEGDARTRCEPTEEEETVMQEWRMEPCSHRECAAVMLQHLPSALVDNVPATEGDTSMTPLFASAYLCRVRRQDPPPEECYCYAPRFQLSQFREKWRGSPAQYGLTLVGDSTPREHWKFMASMMGESKKPLSVEAQAKEVQSIQEQMERMGLTRSVILAEMIGRWKQSGAINSQTMPCKSQVLPRITPQTVCPRKGTKVGLIVINWGLHMMHFEPRREEPKTALFYAYQDFVAGYLLAHLEAALQCKWPTFVAWRTNNVVCDRTNMQRRYGNTREYKELRKTLNISQSNTDVTPAVLQEVRRLAKSTTNSKAATAARALLPIMNSNRTGPAAVIATLDGFGTTLIKTIADMAQRRTHQYLLQSADGESYVEVEARHPRIVPGTPPRHADPASFTSEGFVQHRLPPKDDDLTVTDLAYLVRKWTTQSFQGSPATSAQNHKRKAALHHLPPLDVFHTSEVYCAHTDNDARHYQGMQFMETRGVHEAMRFLERAVTAHEHEHDHKHAHASTSAANTHDRRP